MIYVILLIKLYILKYTNYFIVILCGKNDLYIFNHHNFMAVLWRNKVTNLLAILAWFHTAAHSN